MLALGATLPSQIKDEVGGREVTKDDHSISSVTACRPSAFPSVSLETRALGISNVLADVVPRPVAGSDGVGLAGTVLGVFTNDDNPTVYGSAFLVAPGVALAATHLFSGEESLLTSGVKRILAFSLRSDEVQLWEILSLSMPSGDDDTCILSVAPFSDWPKDGTYFRFPTSTRVPKVGETVSIFGYRDGKKPQTAREVCMAFFSAQGKVIEHFLSGRDRRICPHPCIEIGCGSLGGMSGGVAIDANGHAIGLVSRGLETIERNGPTYISPIFSALCRNFKSVWPAGLFPAELSLLDLPDELVTIHGRSAFRHLESDEIAYTPWS